MPPLRGNAGFGIGPIGKRRVSSHHARLLLASNSAERLMHRSCCAGDNFPDIQLITLRGSSAVNVWT
jgi:hypothetical protein